MQPESRGRQQGHKEAERFLVTDFNCQNLPHSTLTWYYDKPALIILGIGPFPETEGSRVKQKLVELKSRVNEDDLNIKIDKMGKWLTKGNFVNIVIKVAKNSNKKEAEAVKSKIEAAAALWKAENADILGTNNAKLIITIK